MFFLLSKLLWMATAPVTVLVVLVLVGAGLAALASPRAARAGRRTAAVAAVLLLAIGVLPCAALLFRPLEDRFPQPPADLPAPTGIVVLGGSTDEDISAARGRVTITNAAERITEAVVLARRYPQARLVFSGGSSALTGVTRTEADDTRSLWIAMGVAADRITIEKRSRNTDQNARFTKALIQPQPGQTWLLLTSAYHMPRAVGLFRANDFPVIPYPVDYHTSGTAADWRPDPDVAAGLHHFDFAVHEWIGLVAYYLAGKTKVLFPGPSDLYSRP